MSDDGATLPPTRVWHVIASQLNGAGTGDDAELARFDPTAALAGFATAAELQDYMHAPAADRRARALARVNAALGLQASKLTAVYRETGEDGGYLLAGPHGEHTCTPAQLSEWRHTKRAIREATGLVPRRLRAREWDAVEQDLVEAATPRDVGDDATHAGAMAAWLDGFLGDHPPAEPEPDGEGHEALLTNQPCREPDGTVLVPRQALHKWLTIVCGERRNMAELRHMAARAGWEPERVNVDDPRRRKRTTRRVWRVPPPAENDQ